MLDRFLLSAALTEERGLQCFCEAGVSPRAALLQRPEEPDTQSALVCSRQLRVLSSACSHTPPVPGTDFSAHPLLEPQICAGRDGCAGSGACRAAELGSCSRI